MDALDLNLPCSLEPTGILFVASDRGDRQTLRLNHSWIFLFVARGELVVSCGSEIRLGPQEGLLLRQWTPRTIGLRRGEGAEYYALKFKDASRGNQAGSLGLSVPARGLCARPDRLTDLLRRYLAEHRRKGSTQWVLYNLLILILCEFSAAAGGPEGQRAEGSSRETIASMVDAYIAAHYRESIATADVARDLRYSPGYLERAYRKERGVSVRNAIHLRRIREARAQLILQRERHVSEIAALCGYADAAYFRRVFKRTTNMTPVRFRSVNSGRRPDEYTRAV